MHYLLYFPGERAVVNDCLARCGLAALARDAQPSFAPAEGRGPDDGPGMYCGWLRGDASDPPLGCLLPDWDWQPCRPSQVSGPVDQSAGNPQSAIRSPHSTTPAIAAGAYWVGLHREARPTPAELVRKQTFAGYWIRLGDGQQWHCPTARFFPHVHGIGLSGQYERQIEPAFARFWEQSQQYAAGIFKTLGELNVLEALHGPKAPHTLTADFDLAETFAFAVEALAYNYRLNAEIVTRLALLNDDALRNIVKAAVDLPVLLDVRAEKKTAERVSIPVGASS